MASSTDRLSQSILDFFQAKKWKRWILILLVVGAVLYVAWTVRAIWVPLAIAFLIAMILDPVVDRLEHRGWSRLAGTALIFASFVLSLAALLWHTVPAVASEASHLNEQISRRLPDRSPAGIRRMLEQENVAPTVRDGIVHLFKGVQRSVDRSVQWFSSHAVEVLENLIWLVIIPIVTFYALKDFHLIFAKALLLVPKQRRDFAQTLLAEVSGVFGKYMRGLMLVSFLNGLATWLLLLALGTESALTLGMLAGVLYPVPYVGAIMTVVLIIGVEFVTRGMEMMIPVVAANILLHQVIFDYVISPRILGGHVGLHPIWSIIALLAGNALMGFVGMILAVPVAASVQIAVVALVPKLGKEVELPAADDGESLPQLEASTKEEHLKIDAVEELHRSVTEAVERIEAEVDDDKKKKAS